MSASSSAIREVLERLDELQRELEAVAASRAGGCDCRVARVIVAEIKRCDRRLHELQKAAPGASAPDRSDVASACGLAPRGGSRALVASMIGAPVAELDLGYIYEVRS